MKPEYEKAVAEKREIREQKPAEDKKKGAESEKYGA